MKSKVDLVKGWLSKAENDLTNARMCLGAGQALDTACFHAQQAAEKCIKAYLTANEVDFPFVHNLGRLIDLCAERDPSFQYIRTLGEKLTPYAVQLRYSADFWPNIETAREAYEAALKIKAFV
jgi:HEPN domain-containing protein